MAALDAHARPPDSIRLEYKRYQKLPLHAIDADDNVFDPHRHHFAGCVESSFKLPTDIHHVVSRFLHHHGHDHDNPPSYPEHAGQSSPLAYEHPKVPGLIIIPSLVPPTAQLSLLDRLLHRHLSHPSHKTNLHMHYHIQYPQQQQEKQERDLSSSSSSSSSSSPPQPPLSFFSPEAQNLTQQPIDPSIHKPLSTTSCLNKKFRWVTLGGQYDWTRKTYPSTPPPPFPPDIADLIQGFFPSIKAEAAIVNLYTPGDTLSLHRDVSEMCDRDLVSVSLGCDGIFIAALDGQGGAEGRGSLVMRLRSGDAVVMSGKARFAWHGVPQILAGTCPEWMQAWPATAADADADAAPFVDDDGQEATEGGYEHWRGWMAKKRINLNVRQMWD